MARSWTQRCTSATLRPIESDLPLRSERATTAGHALILETFALRGHAVQTHPQRFFGDALRAEMAQ